MIVTKKVSLIPKRDTQLVRIIKKLKKENAKLKRDNSLLMDILHISEAENDEIISSKENK